MSQPLLILREQHSLMGFKTGLSHLAGRKIHYFQNFQGETQAQPYYTAFSS